MEREAREAQLAEERERRRASMTLGDKPSTAPAGKKGAKGKTGAGGGRDGRVWQCSVCTFINDPGRTGTPFVCSMCNTPAPADLSSDSLLTIVEGSDKKTEAQAKNQLPLPNTEKDFDNDVKVAKPQYAPGFCNSTILPQVYFNSEYFLSYV